MTRYTVIHFESTQQHSKSFTDFDSAYAYAKTLSPESNGKVDPNVPETVINDDTYEKGLFWFGNRYAFIEKGSEE